MQHIKLTVLALSAALLSCTSLAQDEQKIEVIKTDNKAKVVWVDNGNSQTINLDGVDLSDKAALQQALSALPEEKRNKLIAMFSEGENGKVHILSGADGVALHSKKMVIELDKDSTDEAVEHKVIKIHKTGKGGEFELVKSLLENGQFSKEQLQQLQAVLDAKH